MHESDGRNGSFERSEDASAPRTRDARVRAKPKRAGLCSLIWALSSLAAHPAAAVMMEIGALATFNPAADLEVSAGFVYASGFGGIAISDISDPTVPSLAAGIVPTPGTCLMEPTSSASVCVILDVDVEGELMYAAARDFGWWGYGALYIFDVSDPTAPVEIGALGNDATTGLPLLGSATAVDVVGDLAYVTVVEDVIHSKVGTLKVVDLSDPANPVEIGAVAPVEASFAFDVEVVGGYAYVADSAYGLRVIDVSDPTAPVEIGSLSTPPGPPTQNGKAVGVRVVGDIAYLTIGFMAGTDSGLRVVDVSDPSAPVEVGALAGPGSWHLEVAGGLAYMAESSAGLRQIDICDPAAPTQLDAIANPFPADESAAFDVEDGLAYVQYTGWLRVIDLGAPVECPEPGVGTSLLAGMLMLGSLGRRGRRL